jgi:hypothetical protein
LLADGTLNFLGDRTNYKAKDISGKITNLLIHINHLFNSICYQIANKTTNFLCVIQLLIYIIDGFVSFIANLLDRATDGATVSVRKCASLKELLFVRFSVCKIIVFIKGA